MWVESLIRRDGPTFMTIDQMTYAFNPDPKYGGRAIGQVCQAYHRQRMLDIRDKQGRPCFALVENLETLETEAGPSIETSEVESSADESMVHDEGGGRVWTCELCGKECKSAAGLLRHKRVHREEQ